MFPHRATQLRSGLLDNLHAICSVCWNCVWFESHSFWRLDTIIAARTRTFQISRTKDSWSGGDYKLQAPQGLSCYVAWPDKAKLYNNFSSKHMQKKLVAKFGMQVVNEHKAKVSPRLHSMMHMSSSRYIWTDNLMSLSRSNGGQSFITFVLSCRLNKKLLRTWKQLASSLLYHQLQALHRLLRRLIE